MLDAEVRDELFGFALLSSGGWAKSYTDLKPTRGEAVVFVNGRDPDGRPWTAAVVCRDGVPIVDEPPPPEIARAFAERPTEEPAC